MKLTTSISVAIILVSLFFGGSALAQCAGGGTYDPQGGVCHQAGGGYTAPNSTQGDVRRVAPDYWGALSVDLTPGGGSAAVRNARARQNAEREAIEVCGSKYCQIALSYKNSCGAVASGEGSIISAAVDENPTVAERKALAGCNKKSPRTCLLWIKASCSGVGY